jgi:hypothetical protein
MHGSANAWLAQARQAASASVTRGMHSCLPVPCMQVRRILDVIRGRPYEEALILAEYMPYKACETILKVLMSVSHPSPFLR